MTKLDLGDKPGLAEAVTAGRVDFSEVRLSAGKVAAAAFALAGWLWAMFGAGAGAVASDYKEFRDRVTVLEAQRVEDIDGHRRQRDEDQKWKERIEDKIDKLVDRTAGGRR